VKHHFFVRYRAFESWAHLNQLAEQWLREEADLRVHGTVHEVVAERFAREAPTLQPLPPRRYDTAYWELRQVGWDAYVEIRGNRYSVPATLAGRPVRVRITLDGAVAIYDGEQCVAQHRLQPPAQGWVTVPDHHAALWADTLAVERRPLTVYEEVATWN
jgi:Mu transposase, C-terminal domain